MAIRPRRTCCRRSSAPRPGQGQRNLNMESIYEYGSRAGFWRLWRMFTELKVQATVYGVTLAMARNPEAVAAMKEAGWEIASHGYRWLEYKDFSGGAGAQAYLEAVRLHTELTGERPYGMYQGKPSDNTLRLVQEEGGFLYSSDSYADDLPYWVKGVGRQAVPDHPLYARNQRHALCDAAGLQLRRPVLRLSQGCVRHALCQEGKDGSPKMMSIGLHCRLVGRPGRAAALKRFMEYVLKPRQGLDPATADRDRRALAQAPQAGDNLMIAARRLRPASAAFSSIRLSSPSAPMTTASSATRTDVAGCTRRWWRSFGRQAPRSVSACCVRIRISPALGDRGRTDRGQQEGAGGRRARPAERRGACPLHRAEYRLCREVRLSVHHRRQGARQGRYPRRPSRSGSTTAATRNSKPRPRRSSGSRCDRLRLPHSAMVMSISRWMISSTRVTPALPPAPSAIEERSADIGALGAERDRLQHVLAGTDAAIDMHLDLVADRLDDLRQHRD
jgi:peptidoglycan/xylan/chitin deacetylase (PgdA/CDA1 family)